MRSAKTIPIALVREGQRMMSICNACRYCEGYCAVFPALERRLSFDESDLNYLANLCHNCGACYTACQYAPPHEFNLNLPKLLAEIRGQTYRKYAWPDGLSSLFARNGSVLALGTALILAMALILALIFLPLPKLLGAHPDSEGSFYALIPHATMANLFSLAALLVLVAMAIGFLRFWRDMREPLSNLTDASALREGFADAGRLRYLDGGGEGCPDAAGAPSAARRRFHHLTAYGFLLCFAATSVATFYHYVLGWKAPYPLFSLPVLLGIAGGLGLLTGPPGLLALKLKRDRALGDAKQQGMDIAFLALLFATGLSGLLLLAFRETAAMGILLVTHLAIVMALFVSMPYGKFVHAAYRLGALIRYALERRRPNSAPSSE